MARGKAPATLAEDVRSRVAAYIVDDIVVGERMRQPTEEAVEAMMTSIAQIGLRTPISVRRVSRPGMVIEGEECDAALFLVSGATRLEAMKRLGRETIECFSLVCDDIDAAIWEIDENLARRGLSKPEMRAHLLRRKELWDERQRQSLVGTAVPTRLKNGRDAGLQHLPQFAASASEVMGVSKRWINRLLAEPRPKPQKPTTALADAEASAFDRVQREFDALRALWEKTGPEARRMFLEAATGGH